MNPRPQRWVFAATLALLSAAGCGSQLAPCAITDRACQEDIYYEMVRLRGDGYDPFGGLPPMRVVTRDELRAEMVAEEARQQQSTPGARPGALDAVLAVLRLVAPEQNAGDSYIDDFVRNTAAYYDSNSKKITIIEQPLPGPSADQGAQMETLAHELVHAFQDRELNFGADEAVSLDQTFALKAVAEGDATLYEVLFVLENQQLFPELAGKSTSTENLAGRMWSWANSMLGEVGASPSPLYAALNLAYPLGGAFLATRWDAGGNAAVRHAYADAPSRSLDYMSGSAASQSPYDPLGCLAQPPADFKIAGGDSLGAAELFAFLTAWKVPASTAYRTALSWTDDVLVAFENPTTHAAAVAWRLDLGAPMPAEVLSALPGATGNPRLAASGAQLLITASTLPETLDGWTASITCR